MKTWKGKGLVSWRFGTIFEVNLEEVVTMDGALSENAC